MKKTIFFTILVLIAIQFIRIDKNNEQTSKELEIKAPQEVMSVFKTSCYDCHSNEVKWPWYSDIAPFSWMIARHVKHGKAALNFSTWENYTEKEKKKKLKGIFRTVYAAMPLQSYLLMHDEANLTKEQRSMIRDWTGVMK
ncbi:MAG: heme-binding domain-containing protein [Halarcobacter sp.]